MRLMWWCLGDREVKFDLGILKLAIWFILYQCARTMGNARGGQENHMFKV